MPGKYQHYTGKNGVKYSRNKNTGKVSKVPSPTRGPSQAEIAVKKMDNFKTSHEKSK